ncbi:MAG: hypothetical protein ACRDPY_24115 [Streptosporangiaceae bacterium]
MGRPASRSGTPRRSHGTRPERTVGAVPFPARLAPAVSQHETEVLDHHGQARPVDFDDASWGHYALDLAITGVGVPGALHPVLPGGYRTISPLPPGYEEHQTALLAARRLYLATWHLANELPAAPYLDPLRIFTGN